MSLQVTKIYYSTIDELTSKLELLEGDYVSIKTTEPGISTDKKCVEVTYKRR